MSDPFRDANHARSEALERLALRHPEAGAIREVEAATEAALDGAVGQALHDAAPQGCFPALAWLGATGVFVWWLFDSPPSIALAIAAGGLFAAHALHAALRGVWRRRTARKLAWVGAQPFPITGIRGYLAAQPAMIDVTFAKPPLPGAVQAGVRGHSPGAEVTALDDRTFRIVLPAGADVDAQNPGFGKAPDPHRLRTFVEEVLVPVHADLGITGVRLGGRMGLRAGKEPDEDPAKPATTRGPR